MKEDDTFLSSDHVKKKKKISEDPKSWLNGHTQKKKYMKEATIYFGRMVLCKEKK